MPITIDIYINAFTAINDKDLCEYFHNLASKPWAFSDFIEGSL